MEGVQRVDNMITILVASTGMTLGPFPMGLRVYVQYLSMLHLHSLEVN